MFDRHRGGKLFGISFLLIAVLLMSMSAFFGDVSAGQSLENGYEQDVPVARSQFRVEPGKSVFFRLNVTSFVKNGRLAGSAMAQGGSGNDIRVLVLEDSQFAKWNQGNRLQVQSLYDSGQRRSIVMSVPISDPGN